jgi:hypothetical protein
MWIVLLGLGAVAGAVLPAGLGAQIPVRRDTVGGRKDTLPSRVDTAGGRRNPPPGGRDTLTIHLPPRPDADTTPKPLVPLPQPKPDTIKAPLARAEAPAILEIGPARIYDRTAMFATGALTLSDLLARVPGLTEFAAGALGAPVAIGSQGDLRRIRLFLDGLELDPMDRRARGVAPVNDLPLHALEEIRIERGAEEVRVYARSWRVDRTVPYTRADISTGDQNSNLYRAFYGRRYDHGEAFQVSAEQFTTQPDRSLPSSDALNLMGRFGMTHGPWSGDAFIERTHKNRAPWRGTGDADETTQIIDGIETQRSTAYLRFGNGDPDRGRWFQAIASAQEYHGKPRSTTSVGGGTTDSTVVADSVAYESQYLLTGGVTRGLLQLSGAERFRVGGRRTSHVASGRASAVSGPLSVSLFAEGKSYLNPGRYEGTAKLSLLDRIAFIGSASRTGSGDFDRLFDEPRSGTIVDENGAFILSRLGPFVTPDTAEATRYRLAARTNLRAEAGFRFRDLWFSGGIMRRGATTLLPPGEFDTTYQKASALRAEGEATARTASIRGRLYKAVYADVWGVAWTDSTGFYRPQYQTRSELSLQTNLLDKFPRGNFGLLTSLSHEYRSSSRFPVGADSVVTSPGFRVLAFKLEIRVQTAVVSYQFRNLLQEKYSEIPGFNMPRQTQFYGIRWDFWN